MSEAKRRQQSDPNYGKAIFHIRKCPFTNNYLVAIGNDYQYHVCDSTLSLEEAQRLLEWYQTEAEQRPLMPWQIKSSRLMMQWVLESPRIDSYPTTTGEVLIFDRKEGTKTELVTVTAQDIIKHRK